MFLTLTIDTHQKRQTKKIRFATKRFNPAAGWRKAIHVKKRGMWQKVQAWRRSLKQGQYKLGGQVAMF